MVGWKRAAGVIEQCCRCFCLRDTKNNPGECRSCRALLNISYSETRLLSFCQPSSDSMPCVTVNWRSEATVNAAGRLVCIN
jgi:hypothetical protein